MVIVSIYQNSFSTLQAKSMNRHITSGFEIPAGSFGVITVVTLTIWVALYDRVMILLLEKCMGKQNGLSSQFRMGMGLVISCIAMAVSALVETRRRELAIRQGLVDDPNAALDMSAMWLVPQYALLGLAEALFSIGQMEFFYTQFPKSMTSIGMAISTLGLAVSSLLGSFLVNIVNFATSREGNVSWLDSDLNKGHVDYYYWLITFLGFLNFVYFLICCRAYEPNEKEITGLAAGEENEEESEYRDLPNSA
ncbi:Protein NRT1/ PTR FAMILY 1.2 like [Actinidia chinensis var. chinensis]|uniref:Protein NRT1/ PTR FAMILY 1.2 like n=1 Tax=Actinidia chinensis var. chinensis TaxID=1590841 RepID=A0A2R6PHA7_ACTCC|nr:Protein NRT1/ PTR FAMILY 1.2 like [Actinidia chinensis var. chinensis]